MHLKQNGLLVIIAFLLVFLTQFPYLYASLQSDQKLVFSGFLFNPLDGNTYLSKMRQGWEGRWFFELTYSPEKSQPAFLFVFYLLLGHLSRIFQLELLICFHLARLWACLALFFALKNFFQWLFEDRKTVAFAIVWAVFGAGLGWLVIPFGGFPPDFWIAEGYGFLSSFANPHFPLAVAIMVYVLTLTQKGLQHSLNFWIAFGVAVILANLSPFGWVITSTVLGTYLILTFQRTDQKQKRLIFFRLLGFGLGGMPFLAYQFWIVRQDPILAEWNRQNVTLSPGFGELLIGYLPLAIWAALGAIRGFKRKDPRIMLPITWVVVSLFLIYIPSSLQRRFLIGFQIPLVALAMLFFEEISTNYRAQTKRNSLGVWFRFSLVLSVVTNVVILFATFQAIKQRDQSIFFYREELEAFRWISQNMPKDAVILASPTSGIYIPAWTGMKVVYGHPFESIYADERKQQIERFYRGEMSLQEQGEFLAKNLIVAIFWGIREHDIANLELQKQLDQTYWIGYRGERITIYQVIP